MIADSFHFDGGAGSFNLCPREVDLSGHDMWTTLSGYSKDDYDAGIPVSEAQVRLSLQHATRLFYNLLSMSGSMGPGSEFSTQLDGVVSFVDDASVSGLQVVRGGQPRERACQQFNLLSRLNSPSSSLLEMDVRVARLTVGGVLVGWGLFGGRFSEPFTATADQSSSRSASVLSSYVDDTLEDNGFTQSFAYVDFHGMSFVSSSRIRPGGGVPSSGHSVDAAAIRVVLRNEDTDGNPFERITSINSLEFFEYD